MKKLKKLELNSKQMTEEELKHILGGDYENECNSTSGGGCASGCKSSCSTCKNGCSSNK